MQLGDAFLMGNPRGRTKHLWVVISDPRKHCGDFIAVNFTTDQTRAERHCILAVGDHPWITETSYCSYGDALEIKQCKVGAFQAMKTIGGLVPQPPLSAGVLRRVRQGALVSMAFPPNLLAYLTD